MQIERLEREGATVDLHVVGRKGVGYFRYVGRAMASTRTDLTDRPTVKDADDLIKVSGRGLHNGSLDAVYVVYARFVSALSTPPTADRLLPVTPPRRHQPGTLTVGRRAWGGARGPARLHPGSLGGGDPRAAASGLRTKQCLSRAGRDGGGRAGRATNGNEERDRQRERRHHVGCAGTYNRARQAQITQEIAEIVGGAAALGGYEIGNGELLRIRRLIRWGGSCR